uniref:Uncharacterized protein n=1 Tax=Ecklonia arborea TaxID=1849970 RepID=A0A8F0FC42_9PHAE|nr:hypothetical protein [Ecklonia arborea]
MVQVKKYSEADLVDFYVGSPVFKKYSQYYLWSENFSEYHTIKYCEIYLSKYIFGCIQKYILEYFSEFFLLIFYNSPTFLKFIKSGFFKYINYHFLLLFQNNFFFFNEEFHKGVEVFVEKYFKKYIQKFFEKDLLICLITCIYEIVPNSFEGYLNNRLKFIYNDYFLIEVTIKSLSNLIIILDVLKNNTIKIFYFDNKKTNIFIKREQFYFFFIVFKDRIYQSFNTIEKISDYIKFNFLSIFLDDIIYKWGNFRIINYNYDFQVLLESFQVLIHFDDRRNNIGIYFESTDVFFEDIKPIYLKFRDYWIINEVYAETLT